MYSGYSSRAMQYRKHHYQSGLSGLAPGDNDQISSVPFGFGSKRLTPTAPGPPSNSLDTQAAKGHARQPRQHRRQASTNETAEVASTGGGGDLDSDGSVDNVPIQEASRVTRKYPVKVPFLSSFGKRPPVSSSMPHPHHQQQPLPAFQQQQPPPPPSSSQDSSNSSSSSSSPYYSAVIEPALSLGQQWPPKQNTFQKVPRGGGAKRVVPILSSTTTPPKKTLVKQMTIHLLSTYEGQNKDYRYNSDSRPKRVLTKPSKEAKNDGYDNEDFDYILKVNDVLGEEKGHQYRVIDLLGQGTFGQVVKCHWIGTNEFVSVKVIKNKAAYRAQSLMEVEILKRLNRKLNTDSQRHILELKHTFMHKSHFCLVFELLSFNLYELIKQNMFRGLSLNLVRVLTLQLLDTMALLKDAKIIHCDLKPENILLTNFESPTIKVIDFGSACHEANKIYNYIQSRFYRSPEILLGLQYGPAIDMWSLGCIVAELFIGIPLFPGNSEYNQLRRIVDMLGAPPPELLDKATNAHLYFNKMENKGKSAYEMKSLDQYSIEQKKMELAGKKYYEQTTLPDLIMDAKSTPQPSAENRAYDKERRRALIDFLFGLLELNPLKRWTPQQARHHPFVTGEPFHEPYDPTKLRVPLARSLASTNDDTVVPSSTTTPRTLNDYSSSQDTVQSLEQVAATMSLQANGSNASRHQRQQRQRAQSMNTLTVPSQLQGLVKDIQSHPMKEHVHNRTNDQLDTSQHQVQSQQPPQPPQQQQQHQQHQLTVAAPKNKSSSSSLTSWYRNRQSRSQGDLVGLLSPSKKPATATSNAQNTQIAPTSADASNPFLNASTRKVKIADMVRVGGPHHLAPQGILLQANVAGQLGGNGANASKNANTSLNGAASGITTHFAAPPNKAKDDWFMDASSVSQLHTGRGKGNKARYSHEGEAAGGLLMMRNADPVPTASTSSTSGNRVVNAFKRRTLLGGA
ncbi:kinase-like domain-containing protein [Gongronella butleri]|nr:kinase-like domain-containing protein [Gongronella butleri]